jgi:hypothetical protein
MAYLGNRNGPRESELFLKLGRQYLNTDAAGFEEDIKWYEDSERREEVVPVHVDEHGEPYIIVSALDENKKRVYLHALGYQLIGTIKTYTADESNVWQETQGR